MRGSAAFLSLSAFLGLASGKLFDVPETKNFLRRGGPSGAFLQLEHARNTDKRKVVVIGNYVYLDGGEISQIEQVDGKNKTPSGDRPSNGGTRTPKTYNLRSAMLK